MTPLQNAAHSRTNECSDSGCSLETQTADRASRTINEITADWRHPGEAADLERTRIIVIQPPSLPSPMSHFPFFPKDSRCSDEESRSFLRHPGRNWSSLNKRARSASLSHRNELEKWRFLFSINPSTSHFPHFAHPHDAREVARYLQLEFQSAIMEPEFTFLDIGSARVF